MFKIHNKKVENHVSDTPENPIFGFGKRTKDKEREKKRNKSLGEKVFNENTERLLEEERKELKLKGIGDLIRPSERTQNKKKLLKEKLNFKEALYDEIIVEGITNIFYNSLIFDEEYLNENHTILFEKGLNVIKSLYPEFKKDLEMKSSFFNDLTSAVRSSADILTEDYFSGMDTDKFREKLDSYKNTIFSEILIEGVDIYSKIKDNVIKSFYLERKIADAIENTRTEENENRILLEQETGVYQPESLTSKLKLKKLTKPTFFQKVLVEVTESGNFTENDPEEKVIGESTLVYTLLETLNVLNLKKIDDSNKTEVVRSITKTLYTK
jgi:hypothetical protein